MRRATRAALALAALGCAAATPVSSATPPSSYMVSTLALGPLRQNAFASSVVLPGRDVAASAAYGGRSYWFFGDTFRTTAPPSLVTNSAAVTTDLDATDGITVTSSNVWTEDPTAPPAQAIAATKAETAFEQRHAAADCTSSKDAFCGAQFAIWPGAPVLDAARHRLVVMYGKVCRLGTSRCDGPFVGDLVGAGLATVDLKTGKVARLTVRHPVAVASPEGRDPALLFGPEGVAATAFADGGYYYSAHRCDPYTFRCLLARAPLAAVEDRAAWTFYAGGGRWSRTPSGAVPALWTGAAGGSVQYVPGMKQWLAIYTTPYQDDVVYRLAPRPWGPWGPAQRLVTTLASQSTVPNYAAFAHPEYAQQDGMVQYVTYYHSGWGEVQLVRVHFCAPGTPVCA